MCTCLCTALQVLELSWRNNLTDFAMPFMIQTMREMSLKIDGLVDKDRKARPSAAPSLIHPHEASSARMARHAHLGYT